MCGNQYAIREDGEYFSLRQYLSNHEKFRDFLRSLAVLATWRPRLKLCCWGCMLPTPGASLKLWWKRIPWCSTLFYPARLVFLGNWLLRQLWAFLPIIRSFSHVYREANTGADALANFGFRQKLLIVFASQSELPSQVSCALRLYELGLGCFRFSKTVFCFL